MTGIFVHPVGTPQARFGKFSEETLERRERNYHERAMITITHAEDQEPKRRPRLLARLAKLHWRHWLGPTNLFEYRNAHKLFERIVRDFDRHVKAHRRTYRRLEENPVLDHPALKALTGVARPKQLARMDQLLKESEYPVSESLAKAIEDSAQAKLKLLRVKQAEEGR